MNPHSEWLNAYSTDFIIIHVLHIQTHKTNPLIELLFYLGVSLLLKQNKTSGLLIEAYKYDIYIYQVALPRRIPNPSCVFRKRGGPL